MRRYPGKSFSVAVRPLVEQQPAAALILLHQK